MDTKFKPIKMIGRPKGILFYLRSLIYKISSALELLILLLLWLVIFGNRSAFGDFTLYDIFTYIIIGHSIGLVSKFFLFRVISKDVFNKNSKLLVYNPIRYFFKILINGAGKNFLPFIAAVFLNLLILYFFIDGFVLNFDPIYLLVIAVMIILSFIIEFLMFYLLNMLVFWKFESKEFYTILIRFKNILAGNYFPISLLPFVFVNISLALPFAYSFFMPAELYLKKVSIIIGIRGIFVQILWILIFYLCIKISWSHKFRDKEKIKVVKTFE